jgi:hypothetical protein
MNGYLGGLIARHLEPLPLAIRPRLRSRFETPAILGLGAAPGPEEIAVERIAEPPSISPRQASGEMAGPPVPETAITPVRPPVSSTRSAAPPRMTAPAETPGGRSAHRQPQDAAPETGTDVDATRPASTAPVTRIDPRPSDAERHEQRNPTPIQPRKAPPERIVVERETRTQEHRLETVERGIVTPPVPRPPVAAARSMPQVATPMIEPTAAVRPAITVTIGRVDVRAVVAPSSPPQMPQPASRPAAPSLEDYLRDRSRGTSR